MPASCIGFESSIPVVKEAEVPRRKGIAATAEARARNTSNETGAKIAKKTGGDFVLVWLGEKVIGTETKSDVLALLEIEGNEKYGRLAPASVFKSSPDHPRWIVVWI